jgi:hypothetical protein
MNRRQFLKAGSVAGAAVVVGRLSWPRICAAGESAPAPPAPSWVDKPMRWAQLTLVEDDPGKFDPQFWLDYFKRTRSDAVCLSAGGCVAYYPTQVPFHHRSAWLGDRDVFGELLAGCRKLGMVVIARMDSNRAHEEFYRAHPDWFAVDTAGRPHKAGELFVACVNSPYYDEHTLRELPTELNAFTKRTPASSRCKRFGFPHIRRFRPVKLPQVPRQPIDRPRHKPQARR